MARFWQQWHGALLILLLSFGFSARWVQAAGEELSWGIEPFLNARTLATTFKTSRDFLGERVGQRIVTSTAANYDQFVGNLLHAEYDFALLGPHTALLAIQKSGYVPLLQCESTLKVYLLVDKNSAYHKIQDLKGKSVALPDHLTLTSMLGAEFFRALGGATAVDVQYRHNEFQIEGPLMVLKGDADAAVMADQVYDLISPAIRDDLRIIGESRRVPGLSIVVHKRVDPARRERLRQASLDFIRTADPKVNVFVRNCGASERQLGDDGARVLAPYVEELKRRLPQ